MRVEPIATSKPAPPRDLIRRGRWAVRAVIVTAPFAAFMLLYASQTRFIVLNLSPSVPLGLYIQSDDEPSTRRLVEFRLPPHVTDDGRHARRRVILKPIAAGPGDHVDTTSDWLFINQQCVAPIYTVDSDGRPLPVWRARRVLQTDEFFVFSTRVPNSFDSRYFGPIRRADILAVRCPLWMWGGDEKATGDPSGSPQQPADCSIE